MSNKKVVIFTSPTCGPCKRLKPELAEQAEKRGFEFEIVELSDETRPKFVEKGIRNVPVTMLYEDGEEVDRKVGSFTVEPQLDWWDL